MTDILENDNTNSNLIVRIMNLANTHNIMFCKLLSAADRLRPLVDTEDEIIEQLEYQIDRMNIN